MDLSKISTKDLEYINAGQLDKVSTAGLEEYARQQTISSQPRGLGEEFVRGTGLAFRGAAPVAVGAGAGLAFGGLPGALAGSVALPLAEMATQGANVVLPENYQIPSPYSAVEGLLTQLGLPVPETTGERVIQGAGGGLFGTATQLLALPSIARTATTELGRGLAGQMAQQPSRQLAATVPSTAAAQYTTEATGSPTAGVLAGMATSVPFAAGTRPTGPSRDVLAAQSNAAFEAARNSGISFNPSRFSQGMNRIAADMRQEGYTSTGYPKIEGIFRELTDVNMPKDFTELQALRKMIQNAQASTDQSERRLASILKDRFDNYIVEASNNDIVGAGNREGLAAWNQARNSYSRMMKAEIFEDMLANAEIEKGRASTSTYLTGQIKNLAKNNKKMRLFTPDEQKEIIAAAKGSNTQKILDLIGRLSPTANVFTGGGNIAFSASNPTIGIPLAVTTASARYGSNKLRQKSIENLADTMRKGGLYPKQDSAARALVTRGLISPQQPVTEEEINLIMGR